LFLNQKRLSRKWGSLFFSFLPLPMAANILPGFLNRSKIEISKLRQQQIFIFNLFFCGLIDYLLVFKNFFII